jgi:DNA invertase Pin-like site-specific DNA recombinase
MAFVEHRSSKVSRQSVVAKAGTALKPAYSYARTSFKTQKSVSIEDQERICDELAARHGAFIPPENRFRDLAIRGSVLREDRPGWSALCKLIEAGAVRLLFADEHTRLFRSDREAVDIKEQIVQQRMNLICRDFSTYQNSWELKWDFKAAYGVQEIRQMSMRIRRGLQGLVASGKVTSGIPYGYKRKIVYDSKGDWDYALHEIDPVTSAVVQRIYAERKAGVSYGKIAKGLMTDGIPSPSGMPIWHEGTLFGLIKCPLYGGTLRHGPHRSSQPHLALVSTEHWKLVQAKRQSPALYARGKKEHWASGLIRCTLCGRPLSVKTEPGHSPATNCGPCREKKRVGAIEHGSPSCTVRLVEAALRHGIQLILTHERVAGYRESVARASEQVNDDEHQAVKARIAAIDRRLAMVAASIMAIDDDCATKDLEDQACALRDDRSALTRDLLRVKAIEAHATRGQISEQLEVDPRSVVPAMFNGGLPARELNKLLKRLFPLVVIERLNRSEVLFNLTISPGALFSTLTDTPTIEMPPQSYRVRVVPNVGPKPPKVALLGQVDAPVLPTRPERFSAEAKADRKHALTSWRQKEGPKYGVS